MTDHGIITIRFLDWWLGGTGMTQGRGVDKAAYRDEWGCPALPASQVKGILRESAELWAGWDADLIAFHFGSRTEDSRPGESVEGNLVFGAEALLPLADRQWFAANPAARAELFGQIPGTAIDPATGAARDRSLRLIEAAVPVTLTLDVWWDSSAPPAAWLADLDHLCALTPAFGALKQDGFGRAVSFCRAATDQALAA